MDPLEPLPSTAARAWERLLDRGPATRPDLSEALRVTKQTASTAIAELQRRRLVDEVAVRQGPAGRPSAQYGLHPRAGWVAGVDLGSSRVLVAAARLDGVVVAERDSRRPGRTAGRAWPEAGWVAVEVLQALQEDLGGSGSLLGAGVALGEPVALVQHLAEPGETGAGPLVAGLQVPIWTENDVNCAALAQLRYRTGPVPGSVLHVRLGTGLGAAFVVGGRVVRGARGRAGEVAAVSSPLPWRGRTAEAALGAAGLLRAAGHSSSADLAAATDDLFAAAATGDTAAAAALEDEADGVALLLRDLTAVTDPELVVLSGRIGGRGELRAAVAERLQGLGVLVPVAPDPLGDGATVLGAAALAVDRVVAALVGRPPGT